MLLCCSTGGFEGLANIVRVYFAMKKSAQSVSLCKTKVLMHFFLVKAIDALMRLRIALVYIFTCSWVYAPLCFYVFTVSHVIFHPTNGAYHTGTSAWLTTMVCRHLYPSVERDSVSFLLVMHGDQVCPFGIAFRNSCIVLCSFPFLFKVNSVPLICRTRDKAGNSYKLKDILCPMCNRTDQMLHATKFFISK